MFKTIGKNIFACRLQPFADLKKSITDFIKEENIHGGWVITCVGSLSQFHLRFANQPSGVTRAGHFEIVSLAGTLGINGCHLHMALADESGSMVGGHLLDGCIIYTTAEIIIGTHEGFIFERETDVRTGFRELVIKESNIE